jgi:hypothetical protein
MMTEQRDERDERVRAAVRTHIAAQHVPPPNLARIVARAEGGARPRRRSGWVIQAVAAAVAVVVCGTVTAVAVTVTQGGTRYAVAPLFSFSPDKIPDFAKLPGPESVWPDAVRRLPPTLPDGTTYRVTDTTDGDDLLVIPSGRAAGPLLFNPDTEKTRGVATATVTDGLSQPQVTTAWVAGDRVVWFLEGRRAGQVAREAWLAPLGGGTATKLADLPAISGTAVLAGDAMIWEEFGPGRGKDDVKIRRLPLDGGPIADVPGSRGYWLSTIPGWITTQYPGTPHGEPERSGELVDVATGKRYRWKANEEMVATVQCGPTWCAGWTVGEEVAVQDLDGREYTPLKVRGSLDPGLDGRLAIGSVGDRWVVWDRETGRAAAITPDHLDDPFGQGPAPFILERGSDLRSPVQVWRTADGSYTMLDLKRLW